MNSFAITKAVYNEASGVMYKHVTSLWSGAFWYVSIWATPTFNFRVTESLTRSNVFQLKMQLNIHENGRHKHDEKLLRLNQLVEQIKLIINNYMKISLLQNNYTQLFTTYFACMFW